MKNKYKIFYIIIVFILIPSCNTVPKESIIATKPGHEVYSSIQGEYVVSYITNNVVGEGPQYTVLGYLVLDEEEYSFIAEEGVVIPQDIYERFL